MDDRAAECLRVTGPARLEGTVEVPGAKNSALKLMAVALLAEGTTRLSNVPDISDVATMLELLRRLGVTAERDVEGGIVHLSVPSELGHRADYDLVRALRASITVLGPLLARTGQADVAVPGGDAIGSRGLDMHADGLARLGATVHVEHGYLVAEAPRGLHGAHVHFDFPSVGATENILLAAVLARGRTVVDNAAREPEIVDIIAMLRAMGAQIEGAGTSRLVIDGVERLQPVQHHVVPDRIMAGTWAFAAAMTRGDITVRGAHAAHLALPLRLLEGAGCAVTTTGQGFRVRATSRPRAFDVATLPYPGFPTDLQPFALAYSAVADGSAMVTENLFEGRFRTVHELARLGADMVIDGHHVMVHGVPVLSGAPVESADIRNGAALVLAGLVAEGETAVSGVHHIDRGYPRFEHVLASLGADVVRERHTGW